MSDVYFCQRPDRHEPKLTCGYPLPCPHHTAIVDTTDDKDTIVETPWPHGTTPHVDKLLHIGDAIAGAESTGDERRELLVDGVSIKLADDD